MPTFETPREYFALFRGNAYAFSYYPDERESPIGRTRCATLRNFRAYLRERYNLKRLTGIQVWINYR
jgi:hypothetical protein